MGMRQRSVSEVHKILDDYRHSKLTITAYCSQHSLNPGTFHWWLSRERKNKQNGDTISPFIRLVTSKPLPSNKVANQQMSIEIELRNGVRTRIQAALSFSELTDLLSVCGR
jgi:hypothetical protein